MIGKQELRRAFGNKPFITKGQVKEAMDYKNYRDIRPFFMGLQHIGSKYLTEDVIAKIIEHIEYED